MERDYCCCSVAMLCLTLCDPMDWSPPASSVHGIFQARILDAMLCYDKSLQLCPTLCDPIDSSPLGSPVPGILQARTQEWVAISFSNAWKWKVKEVAQSCPTLSDPMDCSLPGSSIRGIFQARVLEWGAIAFSKNIGEGCHFLLQRIFLKVSSRRDSGDISTNHTV